MHIPGHQGPLTDATGWTDDHLFWPAFLLQVGHATSAPEAFDADPADLDAYCDRFEHPDSWPVFTVPLSAGTLHLIICNQPDDIGIDWHFDDTALQTLKTQPPYARPGLPWNMLSPQPAHLLMALPTFGDHTPLPQHHTAVAHALRQVGATRHVNHLATDLLDHRAVRIL